MYNTLLLLLLLCCSSLITQSLSIFKIADATTFFAEICEGKSGRIICFGGRKIKVIYANYGRKRYQNHCGFGLNTKCESTSSFEKVRLVFRILIPYFYLISRFLNGRPMKGNPRQSTWILDSTPWIRDSRYWIPVFVRGVDNL